MPIDSTELLGITLLTLQVTLGAALLGSLIGVPLGGLIGLARFRGRGAARTVLYAFYALPPVLVGLIGYLLLRREGPLGGLEILFTPWAILLGETLLTTPIIAGLTAVAFLEIPAEIGEAVEAAGPTRTQQFLALLGEARYGVIAAILVGYGRSLAEVAAALILGGNIRGETRTLGTAILQEVNRGDFGLALTLGGILLAQALVVSYALFRLQRAERSRTPRRGRRAPRSGTPQEPPAGVQT